MNRCRLVAQLDGFSYPSRFASSEHLIQISKHQKMAFQQLTLLDF